MQSSYNDIKTYTPTTLPFVHSGQTGLPLCVGAYFYMKPIKGYEDYLISECGTIVINSKTGKKRRLQNRTIKSYKFVVLYKDNKRYSESIHRLVANTYIPNPLNLPFVNHIDSNPSNNNVTNLEWCTPKQNMEHAAKCGNMAKINKEKRNASLQRMYERYIKKRKPVIDVSTGYLYESLSLAIKYLGIELDKRNLSLMLNGKKSNKTNLQFYEKYITNINS